MLHNVVPGGLAGGWATTMKSSLFNATMTMNTSTTAEQWQHLQQENTEQPKWTEAHWQSCTAQERILWCLLSKSNSNVILGLFYLNSDKTLTQTDEKTSPWNATIKRSKEKLEKLLICESVVWKSTGLAKTFLYNRQKKKINNHMNNPKKQDY